MFTRFAGCGVLQTFSIASQISNPTINQRLVEILSSIQHCQHTTSFFFCLMSTIAILMIFLLPSVSVNTLQQELDDLTAHVQTSSDDSPALPQLRRHILPVSETAATLSTSMVLSCSFRVRPASASSSPSPSSSSSSATIPPLPRLTNLGSREDIRAEFLDHFKCPEYESKFQDEYRSFKAKPGETVRDIGDRLRSLRDQMVNKPSTPALLHKFWSALPKGHWSKHTDFVEGRVIFVRIELKTSISLEFVDGSIVFLISTDEAINIALAIESNLRDPDQTTPTDDGGIIGMKNGQRVARRLRRRDRSQVVKRVV
ncbi:hypothetical protein QOT17_024520 [Balamuthia mandrillaris]